MDADLEDPPQTILRGITEWQRVFDVVAEYVGRIFRKSQARPTPIVDYDLGFSLGKSESISSDNPKRRPASPRFRIPNTGYAVDAIWNRIRLNFVTD
jgi:hypothetical protein